MQGVELTIRALRELIDRLQQKERADLQLPRLVVAGGYDVRLSENREYLQELVNEAIALGIQDKVWIPKAA